MCRRILSLANSARIGGKLAVNHSPCDSRSSALSMCSVSPIARANVPSDHNSPLARSTLHPSTFTRRSTSASPGNAAIDRHRPIVVPRIAKLPELVDHGNRVIRNHSPNVEQPKPAVAPQSRLATEAGNMIRHATVASIASAAYDGFQTDTRCRVFSVIRRLAPSPATWRPLARAHARARALPPRDRIATRAAPPTHRRPADD
jgi:hypothetical protein